MQKPIFKLLIGITLLAAYQLSFGIISSNYETRTEHVIVKKPPSQAGGWDGAVRSPCSISRWEDKYQCNDGTIVIDDTGNIIRLNLTPTQKHALDTASIVGYFVYNRRGEIVYLSRATIIAASPELKALQEAREALVNAPKNCLDEEGFDSYGFNGCGLTKSNIAAVKACKHLNDEDPDLEPITDEDEAYDVLDKIYEKYDPDEILEIDEAMKLAIQDFWGSCCKYEYDELTQKNKYGYTKLETRTIEAYRKNNNEDPWLGSMSPEEMEKILDDVYDEYEAKGITDEEEIFKQAIQDLTKSSNVPDETQEQADQTATEKTDEL